MEDDLDPTAGELNQKISERLVFVLFLTLFTIVLWGAVQIISSFTQGEEPSDFEQYREAYPSEYNQVILDEFEYRKLNFEPVSQEEFETGNITVDQSQNAEEDSNTGASGTAPEGSGDFDDTPSSNENPLE